MRRGEIRLVDLDPVREIEAAKHRPAVVVSNDAANTTAERLGRGVVTIVPVTSSITRVHPFQVLLPAAVERIGGQVGVLRGDLADALDEALRLLLAL